jgi:hypothetical protein
MEPGSLWSRRGPKGLVNPERVLVPAVKVSHARRACISCHAEEKKSCGNNVCMHFYLLYIDRARALKAIPSPAGSAMHETLISPTTRCVCQLGMARCKTRSQPQAGERGRKKKERKKEEGKRHLRHRVAYRETWTIRSCLAGSKNEGTCCLAMLQG